MENINIKINKLTRQVNLSKSVIGNDGENLQEKLVFFFDNFVNGTARLELIKQGETASYIMLTKVQETYQIPVRSVMTKAGKLNMQLVITEGTDDEEIPIFKSNQFYVIVNSSINAQIEEEEEYPQWIDVANAKLNEIDEAISRAGNLDIDVSKEGTVATVTIIKQDETQESVEIHDGERGPQGERGPKGDKGDTGETGAKGDKGDKGDTGPQGIQGERGIQGEQGIQGIQGPKGDTGPQGPVGPAGSIRMVIVNTLPDTGEEGTLYFVPKTPDTSDLYDEYVWINNAWELLGEKQITVDLSDYYTKQETYSQAEVNALIPNLTNYVKNTDYATSSKGGVFKITSNNGADISGSGNLYAKEYTYSNYQSQLSQYGFIGKTTLENVITGKGLVSNTNYASNSTGGVIKVNNDLGTNVDGSGNLVGTTRSYSDYSSGWNSQIISKGTLENVLANRIGDISSAIDLINGESV